MTLVQLLTACDMNPPCKYCSWESFIYVCCIRQDNSLHIRR